MKDERNKWCASSGVRWLGLGTAGILVMVLILGNSGCSTTQQQQPNLIAKAQGAQNPVPAFSGFLGYYGRLQPGGKDQALYWYVDTSANWSQYNAIIIDPVSFWDSDDSSVSQQDQQMLCDYFYNQLRTDMVKYFSVVDEPGPGVLRLQVTITKPSLPASNDLRTSGCRAEDQKCANILR